MPNSQVALLKLKGLQGQLEQQIKNNCTGQGILSGIPKETLALIADEVSDITCETMAELERVKSAIALLEADGPNALDAVLALLSPEQPPLHAHICRAPRTLH